MYCLRSLHALIFCIDRRDEIGSTKSPIGGRRSEVYPMHLSRWAFGLCFAFLLTGLTWAANVDDKKDDTPDKKEIPKEQKDRDRAARLIAKARALEAPPAAV